MSCPQCQESARFVGYRPKAIISLVGEMQLSRPYYHCAYCGTGIWPWDETLRLSPEKLTPGAQEVVTLLGITNSLRWTPLFGQKKGVPSLLLCRSSRPANSCSCFFVARAVSRPCRVKRRLALLASIQPKDSPAEGTPMTAPPVSR